MKEGYRIKGNIIKVNMERKDFDNIVNMFEKVKVSNNRYKYVFM
jgi:hypothetical protein